MKFMVKDKRIQGLRVHCMSIGIFTTMQYIQKYLKPKMKISEAGARDREILDCTGKIRL